MALKISGYLFLFFITINTFAGSNRETHNYFIKSRSFYCYTIDLRNIKNDQLKIELSLSLITQDEVIFCLPKVVPGIYGALDFGRNLSDLNAYDYQDKPLKIEQLDQNRWKIIGGAIKKITYTIDDDWEEFNENKTGHYLSPGSTFQENQVFVLNHNTLFGYLEGYEKRSIQLQIKKPADFYGATSLEKSSSSDTVDYFIAKNYHYLVDNPILYSRPDTTQFKVGGTAVTVAMYSTNGEKLSKEIATYIQPLLEHQKNYLGGTLPVKNYTFLLYLNENPDKYSYLGDGLEHSNSTMILMYMPMDIEMIQRNVYGITSHEFFHTLIPLQLHSEEIEYFNFNQPKLSKHLWLYEGMTEYFTMHMPVRQKVESMDDFLADIKVKIDQMNTFSDDRPLTYLSVNAIENQNDYFNFYLKGALLNLCLDIRLRELSNGKYGVQELVADLMKVYGKEKPFADEDLFDAITKISKYPEIRSFFKLYVEGTTPLPMKEYLEKVGIEYTVDGIAWKKPPSKSQLKLRNAWIGQ